MNRTFTLFIIFSLTLSACGTSPSIWGVPPTPTAEFLNPIASLIDPFAVQDDPIIFPTSTTPPLIETEAAYTPTAEQTPDGASPIIVPTYTPSYDSAPFLYYAQSGDMLSAVANRFGV
jgi:hypothetical protein